MKKVYVEGFETVQVWEQAKRIIGGVLQFSEKALEEMESRHEIAAVDLLNGQASLNPVNGIESTSEDQDDADDSMSDGIGEDVDVIEAENEEAFGSADEEELDDDLDEEMGNEDGEQSDEADDDDDDDIVGPEEELVEDPNGLNDGFFSIDDFNRQSQWFEEQDARGDPNTDHASDDEEVDWGADPLAPSQPQSGPSKQKKAVNDAMSEQDDEDGESEDEDGPTFGNMDLDAPEGFSDDEAMEDGVDDEGNDFNANEVYYKDFLHLRRGNGMPTG